MKLSINSKLLACVGIISTASIVAGCSGNSDQTAMENPFLVESTLPHGAFPFDKLSIEQYKPAFAEAMRQHNAEIDAITNNPLEPNFENTIEALDKSGRMLSKVSSIFYNLLECDGTDDMLALSQEMQPVLSEHSLQISLNEKLFKRVEACWNKYKNDPDALTTEQFRLLSDTYEGYRKAGATLEGEKRERWRVISNELDSLSLVYGQNVQKATGEWSYQLNPETDLVGLPGFVTENLKANDYKLTLLAPSYSPFMKYSARRDLREMLYKAYNSRCIGGEYDNTDVVRRIAALRQEKAELLDYTSYADYRIDDKMAKTPEAVYDLLNTLLNAYKKPAEKEVKEIADFAVKYEKEHGGKLEGGLMPWDFSYYSELLKTAKYDFNDALLKPYFPIEKVKEGVFGLATRLYGLSFKKIDVPVYNPAAECFEVNDADGSFIGLLYTDFTPRETKRPGAWMTEFKGQWLEKNADGTETDSRPHIQIVMSFSQPVGQPGDENYMPALLTYDECSTFLHEFGHALHGLLTKCRYSSQSGTNVKHDFVELPSQFNENFLRNREFLDTFAENYQTGEKIPQVLIDRLQKAQTYLSAYACVRQLSFGMLDMAYHTLGRSVINPRNAEVKASFPQLQDVERFERDAMASTQVMPIVDGCMMSTSFTHIFSGGYAAGYYGYKWAEVLDADAFSVFEKEGIFNKDTAKRFRKLLESGDTVAPDELYREFKGSDPTVEALMRRDGIIK